MATVEEMTVAEPSFRVEPSIRLFDVDEYHRMAEAGILGRDERVELIDGEIITMSPVGTWHNSVIARLNVLIVQRFLDRMVLYPQNSIRLNRRSEPQPDFALLRPRDDFYRHEHPGPADVFLIIEVMDSSADYDRKRKLGVYAGAGIAEVWLVDLKADRVESYRCPAGKLYTEIKLAERGTNLSPTAFPDTVFRVDEILGPLES